MFISQTAMVMIDYFSYPKKATVAVVKAKDDHVPFPDVTLCSMRPFNFYSVNKLEDYYRKHTKYEELSKTGDSFVDAYSMTVAMAFRLAQQVNKNATPLDVSRSDIKMNMLPGILENNTISKEEFIVQCRYKKDDCEQFGSFVQVDHNYYFRCFTYQPNVELMVRGPMQGLSMILMSGNGMLVNETDEDAPYIPGMYQLNESLVGTEGVRVVVHPPNTIAQPIYEGMDVPPGYSVSLGLKPNRFIRAKPPHGDCVDDNPFVTESRFAETNVTVPYRQIECEMMCNQGQIIDKCGCYDFTLPTPPNARCHTITTYVEGEVIEKNVSNVCDIFDNDGNVRQTVFRCGDVQYYCNASASYEDCEMATLNESLSRHEEMLCIRKVKREELKTGSCSDRCPFPCSEYEYDVTYSMSKWPAKGSDSNSVYNEIFEVS